jgi:hypothetical protein
MSTATATKTAATPDNTKAPTVAAPAVDITKMNTADLRDYLNGLRTTEQDLDDDKELAANQKQQAAVVRQIRDLKNARMGELTKVADAIKSHAFSVKELFGEDAHKHFSDEDFAAAAATRGYSKGKPAKAKAEGTDEKKERAAAVTKSFPSDRKPILLTVPKVAGGKGPATDWVVRQGRINEPYNGKSGPAFASIPKAGMLLKGATIAETEKKLSEYLTKDDVTKEYVKTAEGKAELTKIATAIFNYVPPVKKAA